jgi:F420-non-reducing hydrogenase iron-sulfur subunit
MNYRSLKLYILGCSTSFDLYELKNDLAGRDGDELKFISVPCSGKVDLLYLLKLFETGADGVMLMTCKEGECRYLEGNLRARRRVDAVDMLLEEIGLGRGRIAIIQSGDEVSKPIIDRIKDFSREIKRLLELVKERSATIITDATAEHSVSGHGGLE